MKALCFGSINFDYIYQVDHFVQEGETLSCNSLETASGGKGLNQAVALAKAGADTYFAGAVGVDGSLLIQTLDEYGVNTDYVETKQEVRTGHAIIQTNKAGANCILVYRGANKTITDEMIERTISGFSKDDFLLIQNEINMPEKVISTAKERGMQVVLNPSPVRKNLLEIPHEQIDYLVLNEIEACQLSGAEFDLSKGVDFAEGKAISKQLQEKYPNTKIVLTLGDKGSIFKFHDTVVTQKAFKVKPVDTTAAGDTFTGYFIASIMQGKPIQEAMRRASKASSITVTGVGAAQSIPKI